MVPVPSCRPLAPVGPVPAQVVTGSCAMTAPFLTARPHLHRPEAVGRAHGQTSVRQTTRESLEDSEVVAVPPGMQRTFSRHSGTNLETRVLL